jgi:gas vesicle protein
LDATPDSEQVKQQASKAVGIAQENPIGLALGGVAVGVLAGMLIPSTQIEHERMGPIADQVKERARDTGEEALERGKTVAQEAVQSAAETARESGRGQAEELKSSAQDNIQHAKQAAQQQS